MKYLSTVTRLQTMTYRPPSRTHFIAVGCFSTMPAHQLFRLVTKIPPFRSDRPRPETAPDAARRRYCAAASFLRRLRTERYTSTPQSTMMTASAASATYIITRQVAML